MVKAITLFTASTLLAGILAWMGRGVYDRHFMMQGAFHIVSHSSEAQDVLLKFPSGQTKAFNLQPGATTDFRLMETGEGSIAVSLNGKPRATVGYVTTMNGIVVLVIGDETTGFSQIFPALKTASPCKNNPPLSF